MAWLNRYLACLRDPVISMLDSFKLMPHVYMPTAEFDRKGFQEPNFPSRIAEMYLDLLTYALLPLRKLPHSVKLCAISCDMR
jgi:hypothetical protein